MWGKRGRRQLTLIWWLSVPVTGEDCNTLAAGWGSDPLMGCDFLTTCDSNRLIGLSLKKPWGARSKDAFGAGLLSSPERGCDPAVLRRQHWLYVPIVWAQTIQRPTLCLSASQLAVWDFSESLSILICVAKPCGWPWVARAAMDPSCKGSCLQSQPKCRLPLERCEYAAEVYGYPSDTWHTGQRL